MSSFNWQETFNYPAGDLAGNGGWYQIVDEDSLSVLGSSPRVATAQATSVDADLNNYGLNSAGQSLTSFDPTADYTATFSAKATLSGNVTAAFAFIGVETAPANVDEWSYIQIYLDFKNNTVGFTARSSAQRTFTNAGINDNALHTLTLSNRSRVGTLKLDGNALATDLDLESADATNKGVRLAALATQTVASDLVIRIASIAIQQGSAAPPIDAAAVAAASSGNFMMGFPG